MNNGSTDSEPSALTTGLNKNDSLNCTVVRSYIQIFSA